VDAIAYSLIGKAAGMGMTRSWNIGVKGQLLVFSCPDTIWVEEQISPQLPPPPPSHSPHPPLLFFNNSPHPSPLTNYSLAHPQPQYLTSPLHPPHLEYPIFSLSRLALLKISFSLLAPLVVLT